MKSRFVTIVVAQVLIGCMAGRAAAAAPTLYPAPGQADACIDTPLRLVFDRPIALGRAGRIELFDASNDQRVQAIDLAVAAGRQESASQPTTNRSGRRPDVVAEKVVGGVRFTYYPVHIDGNTAEIDFASPLDYGKRYYVKIDPGVFTYDAANFPGVTDATAWRFTVRPAPQERKARIVVATDASGDFNTVQGAIDSVPDGNTTPTTILIKRGHYTGLVNFANKHALTFLGEDRKQTVLQYANNNNFNKAGNRGVFNARGCTGLVLANLTVRNLTPLNGSQAETILLRNDSDAKTVITGCDFYSTQDTVQVNGQTYFNDCYIEGTVDFIWGTGASFFEDCHIRAMRTPGYYTQVRNKGDARGFVFYHCTFDGAEGVTRNVFARIKPSGYPESECVLIECKLGPAVSPRGFLFDGKEEDPKQTRFYEYGSVDLQGQPADVSQRVQSRQLRQPDDADLIRNYSDVAWVLGGWKPVIPEELKHRKR